LDIIHNAHGLFGETLAFLKKVKHAGWFKNNEEEGQPIFTWRGEITKKTGYVIITRKCKLLKNMSLRIQRFC